MKLKIFTLKFSETVDGFDDSAIQDFQAEREIIEVTEHFFVHEQTPYLTVLLSYRNISADEIRKPVTKRRSDPRADLDEEEKIIYDVLRSWRAVKAVRTWPPGTFFYFSRTLIKPEITKKSKFTCYFNEVTHQNPSSHHQHHFRRPLRSSERGSNFATEN